MSPIVKGQIVTFNCTSFLEDGSALDDPDETEPFVMKAGVVSKEEFPTAISGALVGMTINESKHLRIPPHLALGEHDPKKVYRLPTEAGREYKVGDPMQLLISNNKGEKVIDGIIIKHDGDQILVDANHPLSGKVLLVKIQILSVKDN